MADLRVENTATTEAFLKLLHDQDVALPLRLSEEYIGVVLDADGRDVLVVDVNSERPNDQVAMIAGCIMLAVNIYGGFRGEVSRHG